MTAFAPVATFLALQQASSIPDDARPVIAGVGIAYFVVVAIIGIWATRRTRSASDFCGRSGHRHVHVGHFGHGGHALRFCIHRWSWPGVHTGTGAVFIILPASLTNTMGAWMLAKRLRLLAEVREMITIP